LYRNALALTYVTFFGPENLPPLEAFALGCPVIASNVSGAQEQLGDAAMLVDPKDEEQIANAIKLVHDDLHVRRTLVERGIHRASKWTGEDFVRSVFSILDEFEPIRRCWGRKRRQYAL
jgi:glycosyltransferase involved in cell wall biosynthesis